MRYERANLRHASPWTLSVALQADADDSPDLKAESFSLRIYHQGKRRAEWLELRKDEAWRGMYAVLRRLIYGLSPSTTDPQQSIFHE